MTTGFSQHFSKACVVCDLIGPIIDISRMPQFDGLDCRFDSEDQIAKKLSDRVSITAPITINLPIGRTSLFTDKDVFAIVENELARASGMNFVERGIIDGLLAAAKAGFRVFLTSTVSEVSVFKSAEHAVRTFISTYYDEVDANCLLESIKFERLVTDENTGCAQDLWVNFLREFKGKESVIVVNDRPVQDWHKITQDMYYEWIPGVIDGDSFRKKISEIISSQALKVTAFEILRQLPDIKMSDTKAVGGFCILNKDMQDKIKQRWDAVMRLRKSLNEAGDAKPICVFLGGPPGSGKSFFVEQCAKELRLGKNYEEASLSGVHDGKYAEAIDRHIKDAKKNEGEGDEARIAFLDEVDTVIGSYTVFRHLMDPMTGKLTTPLGEKDTFEICKNLVWFFAGSAGSSRRDFIDKFKDIDKKVVDFFDRIPFYFELPGVNAPEEAILQAIINLKRQPTGSSLVTFEKRVLLAFASTNWRSARHLISTCQLIGLNIDKGTETLRYEDAKLNIDIGEFNKVHSVCEDVFEAGDAVSVIL